MISGKMKLIVEGNVISEHFYYTKTHRRKIMNEWLAHINDEVDFIIQYRPDTTDEDDEKPKVVIKRKRDMPKSIEPWQKKIMDDLLTKELPQVVARKAKVSLFTVYEMLKKVKPEKLKKLESPKTETNYSNHNRINKYFE